MGLQPATKPCCPSDIMQHGFWLGSWLSKHAVLLQSLQISLWPEQETAVAAAFVAAKQHSTALSAAAPQPAAPGSLPLASLKCASPTDGRLLCSLAGVHLTELVLHLQLQDRAGASQQYCAALASLAHLQRLSLAGAWCEKGFIPVLGPALQHLTALTKLRLPRVLLDAASIQMLPTSVQDLTVCCHNSPLQLQHLTALRTLHLEQQLHEGETLPPSLTALWLGRCEGVQPLLALPNLQWLRVDYDVEPEQLQGLAQLPQLQALLLSYFCCTEGKQCDQGTLACAAAHLSKVPLRQLTVLGQWGCGRLAAVVVQQLSVLTQLTSLSLQDLVLEVSPVQLAQQLQQLPVLQQLELRCLQYEGSDALQGEGGAHSTVGAHLPEAQGSESLQGVEGDWAALAAAVSGMTSLRELSWLGMPSRRVAAAVEAQLQTATQLTQLSVGEPCADEVAVAFRGCCGLR